MNEQQLVSCLGLAGFVTVVVVQPVRADVNQVTSIELKQAANSIEIVLKTTHNKQLQVFTSSGKTFVANIVNTQLQLLDKKDFRRENPTEGIAAVTANAVGANSIRIVVTGKTQLLLGQVTQNQGGLVLSWTVPSQTTAQKPKPQPPTTEVEPQSEPEAEAEPSATKPAQPTQPSDEEPIEVTVTAMRTEEPLEKIPRSVTVITREQIEDQSRFTRNLADILGRTVPGFSPPMISTLIAKVLRVDDSRKLPLATKIVNAMFPLHIGAYGGVWMRILYIFNGIAPAVLPIGFVIWCSKTYGAKNSTVKS